MCGQGRCAELQSELSVHPCLLWGCVAEEQFSCVWGGARVRQAWLLLVDGTGRAARVRG